jgi:hypothetical protein
MRWGETPPYAARLSPMTYLCIAIFVSDEAQARRDIAVAAEAGADMVELRIDEVADAATASRGGGRGDAPLHRDVPPAVGGWSERPP